jgi:hypothetical protein
MSPPLVEGGIDPLGLVGFLIGYRVFRRKKIVPQKFRSFVTKYGLNMNFPAIYNYLKIYMLNSYFE